MPEALNRMFATRIVDALDTFWGSLHPPQGTDHEQIQLDVQTLDQIYNRWVAEGYTHQQAQAKTHIEFITYLLNDIERLYSQYNITVVADKTKKEGE